MKLGIAAIGLIAPGLDNWSAAQAFFQHDAAYDPDQPLTQLAPSLLPANERRRTTPLIKLALQCGQDALDQWQGDITTLASVFASSGGDLEIVDKILTALGMEGKPVSPTHFHNSVHNAPAGYWSIAAQAQAPSTSISAFDASFAAGLLEAATQVVCEKRPVLLISYDIPPPATLHPFRPLTAPFATAMILCPPEDAHIQARIEIALTQGREDHLDNEGLERLRNGNPAARALPLLQHLARRTAGKIRLPYLLDQALTIRIEPC